MTARELSSRPLIGICPDVVEPRPASVRSMAAHSYVRSVWEAGGYPVVLPAIVELIPEHVARCSGIVLTGGDDPKMEAFGDPTHPKATPVHPLRQAFDVAMIEHLLARPEVPVLGVCLGMQMLALVAGGTLNQYLPETHPTHTQHWDNAQHAISVQETSRHVPRPGRGDAGSGLVTSHHRQAVGSVGRCGTFLVTAMSEDGVIEAIERPDAAFCLGVQWHPERTADEHLGLGIFKSLVCAAQAKQRRS